MNDQRDSPTRLPAHFSAFRARFPLLRTRVYVASCSQGLLSVEVEDALAEFRDAWARDGAAWEPWVARVDDLRAEFAAHIGAETDEVAVVPSASIGVSALASALAFDTPRDTVVVGEFEFPTMAHVWLAQQARGARVAWARASGDRLDPSAFASVIDDRTLLVPLTHVCFRNGVRLDVPGITRLAHERGAWVLLDDYQWTGSGPTRVGELGIDALVTGAYKYLLGPSGVGFLYVRRGLVERLTPTVTGWFGRINPFAYAAERLDWPPAARRFETGTPSIPSAYGALAALRLLRSLPPDAVGAHVARLVSRFREGVKAADYAAHAMNDVVAAGPLTVIECTNAPEIVERLRSRGVIASSRGQGLRVAFHAYNNEGDVDAVLAALEAESALLVRRP